MNKICSKSTNHCCFVEDETTEKPNNDFAGPIRMSGEVMSRLNVLTTGLSDEKSKIKKNITNISHDRPSNYSLTTRTLTQFTVTNELMKTKKKKKKKRERRGEEKRGKKSMTYIDRLNHHHLALHASIMIGSTTSYFY